MSISFKIHYITKPNETLYVVFDKGGEVPLTSQEGGFWTGDFKFTPPQHLVWSYVVRDVNNHTDLRQEEVIGTREHDFVTKSDVRDWWYYPWLTEIVEDLTELKKQEEERIHKAEIERMEAEESERRRRAKIEEMEAEEAERKRRAQVEEMEAQEAERRRRAKIEEMEAEEAARKKKKAEEEEAERKRKEEERVASPPLMKSPTPEEKEKKLKIRLCGSESNWDLFKLWTGKACAEVLYDSETDDFDANTFNKCVEGNSSIILFVHSGPYIFGSYTSTALPEIKKGQYVENDRKSFAFSFVNPYDHEPIRYVCDDCKKTLRFFDNDDSENVVGVHNFFTIKKDKEQCIIHKDFTDSYNETTGRGAQMFVRSVEPNTFPCKEIIVVKLVFKKDLGKSTVAH
ncbi:hypothetical protein EIN_082270 [Entamoeba invadens IP1]|uniref:TLDc domain-containing protein n=1 Tax=Entamoeba invadens TaxID=33085 RepID=S0B2K4_ENTIV|nr:hypothetical protein EIN_082270 [Entamoeba invadens IP1]ELP85165.1 hypothetical protein EIN_082270 [Entamoeba invadens IP1]BAN40771.1 hypothetical protein [Entamoeba invadens]BAN40805.1 hypothetical protein [Entamoeba invadens]BAN42543.1 hypothetical protein [Entamoeba invadens]|eukprot:XP_004184511.1 hypothetical protein EIN_082270 [Entamoeba invadens IP1]